MTRQHQSSTSHKQQHLLLKLMDFVRADYTDGSLRAILAVRQVCYNTHISEFLHACGYTIQWRVYGTDEWVSASQLATALHLLAPTVGGQAIWPPTPLCVQLPLTETRNIIIWSCSNNPASAWWPDNRGKKDHKAHLRPLLSHIFFTVSEICWAVKDTEFGWFWKCSFLLQIQFPLGNWSF